jgi:hypothetical protein
VTDFINLKIKPTQSFGSAYKGKVCMCVFLGVSAHMCMSIYIYTVFLKKSLLNLALLTQGGKFYNQNSKRRGCFGTKYF